MTERTSDSVAIDAKTFWRTLGERPIGMTVVTARGSGGPAGFLGLSASHVSADPPTMLVSIDRKTSALESVLASGHFAVNFLDAGAGDIADAFSGKAGLSGADRFRDDDWTTLVTGAPTCVRALGVFDCRVAQVIDHGNTAIVIGTVVGAAADGNAPPLVFFRGKTVALPGGG